MRDRAVHCGRIDVVVQPLHEGRVRALARHGEVRARVVDAVHDALRKGVYRAHDDAVEVESEELATRDRDAEEGAVQRHMPPLADGVAAAPAFLVGLDVAVALVVDGEGVVRRLVHGASCASHCGVERHGAHALQHALPPLVLLDFVVVDDTRVRPVFMEAPPEAGEARAAVCGEEGEVYE